MQFYSYISDLLYRYECVIIPDFGAFLTRSVSAKIDEGSHTFYPPGKAISFNEQLKQNDGLLANYIAEVENIPYEVSVEKIAQKIKSLKSQLALGETLSFKNIGEVVLNNDGRLTFAPSYDLNYLPNSFGLTQFVSTNITREVYKEEVESLEKVIPLTITSEKRKSRPYLRYAAIAVIALGLGGFMASNYYDGQIEQHNQLAQEDANAQLDYKIQEATFIIDNPLPAVILNVAKQSGNYHIVAGAFRIEENSTKKLKQLKTLGYNARKIGVNKYGLHQVVYSSYETRSEAHKALYKVRREHNRDAWLLAQKLN